MTTPTPDTVLGYIPTPPSARLLGWRLIDHDAARGWVRVGFFAPPEFANPGGFVQGGMLSAMLDDTMAPAVLAASKGRLLPASIDLTVSFLAPAKLGALVCEARVVQLGKTIGFVEGSLWDSAETLVARGTSSVRLVERQRIAG